MKKPLLGLLACATLAAAAPTAAQAESATRGYTCLNRASDGFNGCWRDGYEALSRPSYQVIKFSGCDTIVVQNDNLWPNGAYGVKQSNAVAARRVIPELDYFGAPLSTWAAPDHGVLVPNGDDPVIPWGVSTTSLAVYQGEANSVAHFRVTASTSQRYCSWAS